MQPICFRRRLVAFLCVWALTASAFQIVFEPDGATETTQTEIQQRLLSIPLTPLLAGFGLAHFANLSVVPSESAVLSSLLFFGLSALVMLAVTNRRVVAAALCVQIVSLLFAVYGFVHMSKLPSGG